jgi:Uncharacterized protein conserved in bacteria
MLLTLLLAAATAHATDTTELTVVVDGLRNGDGVVHVAVWTSPDGFPGEGHRATVTRSVQAAAGRLTVTIPDVPTGPAAVSVLHDEDEDGEFATSLIGLPKEGVGISSTGDYKRLGPPRFQDAVQTLTAGAQTLTVKMMYLL